MMIALLSIFLLVGAASLFLTIRAVLKGKDYIAASNFGWGKHAVDSAFSSALVSKWAFKLTPFAIMITFGWAGYAIINDLAWPLETFGVISREDGEWQSYRSILSYTVGGPLGLAFGFWLVRLCGRNISKEYIDEELYPNERLAKMVGIKL